MNKTTIVSYITIASAVLLMAKDVLSGTFTLQNDVVPFFGALAGVLGVTGRAAIAKIEAALGGLK